MTWAWLEGRVVQLRLVVFKGGELTWSSERACDCDILTVGCGLFGEGEEGSGRAGAVRLAVKLELLR